MRESIKPNEGTKQPPAKSIYHVNEIMPTVVAQVQAASRYFSGPRGRRRYRAFLRQTALADYQRRWS